MKRRLLAVLLALVLTLVPATGVLAVTSQDVTVTATPSYLAISNTPDVWLINGVTGSGIIEIGTEYWTNPLGDTTTPSDPVVDGECEFSLTNTSTVDIDLTVNFIHFTGGDAMQNSGTGSGGVGTFGAYSYCTGMTYSSGKVIADNSGSSVMKDALGALTDIKWGVSCDTQTDAWTTGDNMTATVTITATAD